MRWQRGCFLAASIACGCVSSPDETTGGTTTAADTTEASGSTGDPVWVGCEDPESGVEAIFDATCTKSGCHGMTAAAGLNLSSDDWAAQLIGQPATQCPEWIRVAPGDLPGSLLHAKLAGAPDCGQPMPVGDMLSPEQIDCIAAWIEQLPPAQCEMCGTGACVDVASSNDHCGACDSPCPTGVACVDGICDCPGGAVACGDTCVDTMADVEHCGGCDAPCDAGFVCNAGACSADCGELSNCGGGCVDTQSNASHCGACDSPCPAGSDCVGGECVCPGEPLSYAADIEPIVVANCTTMGCHSFPAPQEGLDLAAGSGYDHLVGVASGQCANRLRVDPGNPGSSYLLDKLHGTNLCFGTQMPKDGDLPNEQIDLISAWICHGALP